MSEINKSVQSNLRRRPRLGAVAHVRRKVPIGYNGAPQIRFQNTLSRGPIPKPHYLPYPWTHPTYGAKRHPDPIRRFASMHWTGRPADARTYAPTDRPRESLTTIGCCAARATRTKNDELDQYGAEPFEQQQFETAGVEWVKTVH